MIVDQHKNAEEPREIGKQQSHLKRWTWYCGSRRSGDYREETTPTMDWEGGKPVRLGGGIGGSINPDVDTGDTLYGRGKMRYKRKKAPDQNEVPKCKPPKPKASNSTAGPPVLDACVSRVV